MTAPAPLPRPEFPWNDPANYTADARGECVNCGRPVMVRPADFSFVHVDAKGRPGGAYCHRQGSTSPAATPKRETFVPRLEAPVVPCPTCGATTGLRFGDDPRCGTCSDVPCYLCRNAGYVDLPGRDDVEEHPCPVCDPWPHGFPGFRKGNGDWLVPPYPAGAVAGPPD